MRAGGQPGQGSAGSGYGYGPGPGGQPQQQGQYGTPTCRQHRRFLDGCGALLGQGVLQCKGACSQVCSQQALCISGGGDSTMTAAALKMTGVLGGHDVLQMRLEDARRTDTRVSRHTGYGAQPTSARPPAGYPPAPSFPQATPQYGAPVPGQYGAPVPGQYGAPQQQYGSAAPGGFTPPPQQQEYGSSGPAGFVPPSQSGDCAARLGCHARGCIARVIASVQCGRHVVSEVLRDTCGQHC